MCRDGWNLTGDSFTQDEDGIFHFAARSDDMIISSGYNIAGPEVEAALLSHPDVAECGVIGVPDAERGQIVEAHVVLAAGVEPRCADGQAAAGSREAGDRAVQVSALGEVRRVAAQDPDGKAAALPVARATLARRASPTPSSSCLARGFTQFTCLVSVLHDELVDGRAKRDHDGGGRGPPSIPERSPRPRSRPRSRRSGRRPRSACWPA